MAGVAGGGASLSNTASYDGYVTSGPLRGAQVQVTGRRGKQLRVVLGEGTGAARFISEALVAAGKPPPELANARKVEAEKAKARLAQNEARSGDARSKPDALALEAAAKEERRRIVNEEAALAVQAGRNFRIVADAAPVFSLPSIHATQLGIKKRHTSVRCTDEELRDDAGNLQWVRLAKWTYDTAAWMLVDGTVFGQGVLAQPHKPLGLIVDSASGVSVEEKTLAAKHFSTATARERLERLVARQEEEDARLEREEQALLADAAAKAAAPSATPKAAAPSATAKATAPSPPPPAQLMEDVLGPATTPPPAAPEPAPIDALPVARHRLATAQLTLEEREDEVQNRRTRLRFKEKLVEEIKEEQGEGMAEMSEKEVREQNKRLDEALARATRAREEMERARDEVESLERDAKKEALRAAFRLEPAGSPHDDTNEQHPQHPLALEKLRELVRLRDLIAKASAPAPAPAPAAPASRLSARERLTRYRESLAAGAGVSFEHRPSTPSTPKMSEDTAAIASRLRAVENELRLSYVGLGKPLPHDLLDGGDPREYLQRHDQARPRKAHPPPPIRPSTADHEGRRALRCHPNWLYHFGPADDKGTFYPSDTFVDVYHAPLCQAENVAFDNNGEPIESGVPPGEGAPPSCFACCERTNRVFVGFDKSLERDRRRAPVLVYEMKSGECVGRCFGGRIAASQPEQELQHVRALVLQTVSDRELLLALGADRTVLIWDANTLDFLAFVSVGAEGVALVSGVFDSATHSYKSPVTCQSLQLDVVPPQCASSPSTSLVLFASSMGKKRTDATAWDVTDAVSTASMALAPVSTEACYLRSFAGKHSKSVTSVATLVLADEGAHVLFTGGMDAAIVQWDARTGAAFRTFPREHAGSIRFLATDGAFERGDGPRAPATRASAALYSNSADNTIRRWSVETGSCTRVFEGGHDSPCTSMHVSDDGRTLVTAWSGFFGFASIKVWHLRGEGSRDVSARRLEGTVLYRMGHIRVTDYRGFAGCGCDASCRFVFAGAGDGVLSCWRTVGSVAPSASGVRRGFLV